MTSSWTRWRFLHEKEWNKIPPMPGVYQFRSLKKGQPQRIGRVRGTDKEGIIYTGQSSNLRQRISGFWKTLEHPRKSRHAAGWTYIAFRYERVFPKKNLQFRYMTLEGDPTRKEFDLLLEYRKKFMDLPPLNSTRSPYPHRWKTKIRKVFGTVPPSE